MISCRTVARSILTQIKDAVPFIVYGVQLQSCD